MKRQLSTRPSGFTLVEIAIVLVIIGLLLGAVLKGQELVESAKIKNGGNDLNGVASAYNAYIDRFHRLPGDDGPIGTLNGRGGVWATVTAAGDFNGVVNIPQIQVFAGGGEADAFWQALKAAGFIAGNANDAGIAALPRNAFSGLIGAGTGVNPVAGAAVLSVCLSQVPGKAARAIDTQLDDGLPNRGSILATLGVNGTNTAPGANEAAYSDNNQYTLCRSL